MFDPKRFQTTSSCLFVKRGLELVNGFFKASTSAELFQELNRGAHSIEGRHFEDPGIVEAVAAVLPTLR